VKLIPITSKTTARIGWAQVTKLKPIKANIGINIPMKPKSLLEFVLVSFPLDMSLSDIIAHMVFSKALAI
jgi:hypothetical protein